MSTSLPYPSSPRLPHLIFDSPIPARAEDCRLVPHIGSLHTALKEAVKVREEVKEILGTPNQLGFFSPSIEVDKYMELRRIELKKLLAYKRLGGRLIR